MDFAREFFVSFVDQDLKDRWLKRHRQESPRGHFVLTFTRQPRRHSKKFYLDTLDGRMKRISSRAFCSLVFLKYIEQRLEYFGKSQ